MKLNSWSVTKNVVDFMGVFRAKNDTEGAMGIAAAQVLLGIAVSSGKNSVSIVFDGGPLGAADDRWIVEVKKVPSAP